MRKAIASVSFVLSFSFALAACGDDGNNDGGYVPGGGGGSGGAAGAAGAGGGGFLGGGGSAGTGQAGGAGSGGAGGGAPAGVTSNTPAAEFVDVESGATGLTLVSSNLAVDPDAPGGSHFFRWAGEVFNGGAKPACFTYISGKFLDAAGATLVETTTFVRAAPYEDGSGAVPCIPPGETGVYYAPGYVDSNPSLGSVAKVEVDFDPAESSAVPGPNAPELLSTQIVEVSAGRYRVDGAAKSVGTIYNVAIELYAKDASGLIVANTTVFHLDTFPAGETWSFQSGEMKSTPFTEVLLFADYIVGADPGFAPGERASLPAEAAKRAELRAREAEVEARFAAERAEP